MPLELWLILAHILDPRKDKAGCPVFVCRRGIFIVICDLVLHLWYVGLIIWLIYDGKIPSQYLKTVFFKNREQIYFSEMNRSLCESERGEYTNTYAFALCCLCVRFLLSRANTMCNSNKNGFKLNHYTVFFLNLALILKRMGVGVSLTPLWFF